MNITKGTIIRTVLLFSVIINYILKMFNVEVLPLDESQVASMVEAIISILAVLAAWWYNNSFTEKA